MHDGQWLSAAKMDAYATSLNGHGEIKANAAVCLAVFSVSSEGIIYNLKQLRRCRIVYDKFLKLVPETRFWDCGIPHTST